MANTMVNTKSFQLMDMLNDENLTRMMQLEELIDNYALLTKLMYPSKSDKNYQALTNKISVAYRDLSDSYSGLKIEMVRSIETDKDINLVFANIFNEVLHVEKEQEKFEALLSESEQILGITKEALASADQPAAE